MKTKTGRFVDHAKEIGGAVPPPRSKTIRRRAACRDQDFQMHLVAETAGCRSHHIGNADRTISPPAVPEGPYITYRSGSGVTGRSDNVGAADRQKGHRSFERGGG